MQRNSRVLSAKILAVVLFSVMALQVQSFSQDKPELINNLIMKYHDLGQFNGTALVAERGKVIFKKGYGLAEREWNIPHEPNTKLRIGSITKQFTSMLIMQLVSEGKIDLEAKLSDYLPYYRKDTGDKVTIHNLLVHNSGIPSYTSLPNFMDEISLNPYGVEEFVKKFCSGDLEFEPGSKFAYNNSGYFLLGAIIEEITGKTYEQVLKERILEPVGMHNSGYDRHDVLIPHRAAGYQITLDGYENAPYLDMSLPYAAGSLYATVEDMYLWDQALYTERLLSQKLKDLMFTPHMAAFGGHYAYGWSISKKSVPDSEEKKLHIAHGGGINGFNTLIDRQVDDRHLVVLFNNTPGANLGEMSENIFRILYGAEIKEPIKPLADVLYKTFKEKDVDAAIVQYDDLK
ncbi:MAG: beta-lactamase family protein, partial [Candidatus Aminicenantes bacterium]|nr:beta-lactamase family protein [Candidatus Aminicenantes bacterium]